MRPLLLTASTTMNSDKNNPPATVSYADEVLCANWHSLVMMLAEPLARVPKVVLDAAQDPTEAEDFLARLYSCQRA